MLELHRTLLKYTHLVISFRSISQHCTLQDMERTKSVILILYAVVQCFRLVANNNYIKLGCWKQSIDHYLCSFFCNNVCLYLIKKCYSVWEHFRAVQSWLLCAQWRVLRTVQCTSLLYCPPVAECTVSTLPCWVGSEEDGVVQATAGLSPLTYRLGPWIRWTNFTLNIWIIHGLNLQNLRYIVIVIETLGKHFGWGIGVTKNQVFIKITNRFNRQYNL